MSFIKKRLSLIVSLVFGAATILGLIVNSSRIAQMIGISPMWFVTIAVSGLVVGILWMLLGMDSEIDKLRIQTEKLSDQVEKLSAQIGGMAPKCLTKEQRENLLNRLRPYSKYSVKVRYVWMEGKHFAMDLASVFHEVGCKSAEQEGPSLGVVRPYENFYILCGKEKVARDISEIFISAGLKSLPSHHSDMPEWQLDIIIGRLT